MKSMIVASGLALALGIGSAIAQTSTTTPSAGAASGMHMTQSQCDQLWQRADSAKSGSLTQSQAGAYVSDFSQVDTNKDSKLTQAEFSSACQRGMVHDAATTGGSTGTTGSSSSTGSSPTKK